MSLIPHNAPGLLPLGTPGYRICVAVAGSSLANLVENAERAMADSALLELRLDSVAPSLPAPSEVREVVGRLLARHPHLRLIATCRRSGSGGGFQGTVDEELAVLFAAASAGCRVVDLALESAEALGPGRMRQVQDTLAAYGTALLVSFHDYHATRDLQATLARLKAQEAAILKLVSTAQSIADNLPLLALLQSERDRPLVAIAMGERGVASRVLGLCAGSLFTFAAPNLGTGTAPGQVDARTLRALYRTELLGAGTRIFGVAGLPIAHSLSPLVHNTAFAAEKLDAVFVPLPGDSAEDLFRMIRSLPLEGVSVTMPLKEAVLPLLDRVDPLAARVGACNTIVRTGSGALHGYNTDVAGVVNPLSQRLRLRGARVLVWGAGGAARAAVFGLLAEGAEVWIGNRTPARAGALAAEAGAHLLDMAASGSLQFDALVNATPLGMAGHVAHAGAEKGSQGEQAFESSGNPASLLRRVGLVFDMVYNPLETPLLLEARTLGLPVIDGLEMFVHQATSQFSLWTGREAPMEQMIQAARARLESHEAPGPSATAGSHHPGAASLQPSSQASRA